MAIEQVIVPYSPSYNFGVGADLATGGPRGKVVDGSATAVAGAAGSTTTFQVRRIQSTEELEESLGIHVEASGGCGCFSASASFDYAKKSKVQSSSLFMLITAQVDLAILSIDDPILTADAAALNDRPDVFANRYGNMFVRAIGRGGRFVGLLRVNCSDSTEAEHIAASIQGSYGLLNAAADTSFDSVRRNTKSEIYCDFFSAGGPTDLNISDPSNPKEMLDCINRFLESFTSHPEDVAKPYWVALAPTTVARGALPLDVATIQNAQDILMNCAKARSRTMDKLNLLEYILQNEALYDLSQESAKIGVVKAIRDFQSDHGVIADCATLAIRTPAQAEMPVTYATNKGLVYPSGTLPDPLPTLKAGKVVSVPDFSGCQSWSACNELAVRSGLVAQQQFADMPSGDKFKIINVNPVRDTPVQEGSVVTIVTQRTRIRYGQHSETFERNVPYLARARAALRG